MGKRRSYDFADEKFLVDLERVHLIAKRLTGRWSPGTRRSRRIGDGLEFADHRDYVPGDDVRFIDWGYFARMERLLLRLFHEHSEAGVAILLDTSGSMGSEEEKFSYALRSTAALTYLAMGSLDRVTLIPFPKRASQSLRTGRNRHLIFPVLDYLANLQPGGPTELLESVETFIAQRPREGLPGTVVLISDLLDCEEQLCDALARLVRRACDVLVLHVQSTSDASPRLTGPALLQHAEIDQRLMVDVTEELLERYRRRWDEFVDRCERACLRHRATYVPAPTSAPFEKLVLQTLRRAGVIVS